MSGRDPMRFAMFAIAAMLLTTTRAFADSLPMDEPVPINGGEAVCTGIGSAKDDPRWAEYPVRVEFSNGAAQYLAGVHLDLSAGENQFASFDCLGSWVLFRLPAGTYRVSAELTGQPAAQPHGTSFTTSGNGPQKRVEVQFPHIAANE